MKQFLQPMIEQVWEGGGGGGVDLPGGCAAFFASAFQSYCIFVSAFLIPMPFLVWFYRYQHIFLLYIMCISSKSQTVFWAQNFRDIQLIPNFLWYPACLWYCSFWEASLETNCLMDGFSCKIFIKKTAEWSEIKIRFKIYKIVQNSQ